MPIYNYKCSKCKKLTELEMKISEFLKFKREDRFCSDCIDVKLVQIIHSISNSIERDKEYIIQNAKEEARLIVEKMDSGDEKALIDLCGPQKVK